MGEEKTQERQLLEMFRRLNDEGRQHLITCARSMSSQPDLCKPGASSPDKSWIHRVK